MKRKFLILLLPFYLFSTCLFAQGGFKSEEDLKSKATELFEEEKLVEAAPLYAQLLSLYPQDPEYNFKYGACLLATDSDKQKSLKYLNFAVSKSDTDPLAYYYQGRAYHLNYNFGKAVKSYSRFKTKASSDQKEKYQVDRKIEMCKNGNQLLSKINDVQVLERQEIAAKDFYKIYKLDDINGKIIAKPADFDSKYDEKQNEQSVIFLPNGAKEVYYSSYGKKGENKRDIYKSIKLGNGEWSEGVSLGNSINTPYNEDYPFIHPDGRTLYFASEGHSSMGGYDLFKSTFDQSIGQWSTPENLDFAFSSADDDILFVTDKDQKVAYFASNRTNEAGKYTVYKVLTEKKPAELSAISGKFIAENDPNLMSAKIVVVDKATNETVGTYKTDDNGNYTIEIAQNGGDYQFTIETTNDAPIHTGVVSIPKQDEFEVLGQELRLVGSGDAQQLVIKNIFDGTAVNNQSSSGPKISSDLLRMKANLDVNFSQSQLATLNSQTKPSEIVSPKVSGIEEAQAGNSSTSTETKDKQSVTLPNEQTSSGSDQANLTNSSQASSVIANELSSLKLDIQSTIKEQEKRVNSLYTEAIKDKNKAEELLVKQVELEGKGGKPSEIEEINTQTKETALKAAVKTKIAKDIEAALNQNKELLSSFEAKENTIQQNIADDQLASAELELESTKNVVSSKLQSTPSVIEEMRSESESKQSITERQLQLADERVEAFNAEKTQLEDQISSLETQMKSENGKTRVEISERLEALKLDQEDMTFQLAKVNERKADLNSTKETTRVEQKLLESISTQTASLPEDSPAVSETEKQRLVSALKGMRENNLLAAVPAEETTSNNNISADLQDQNDQGSVPNAGKFEEVDQTETAAISANPSANGNLESINTEFQSKILAASNVIDQDLKKAKRLEVYNDWVEALENELIQKESAITSVQDVEEKTKLRAEIDLLLGEINEKSAERDELAQRLSSTGTPALTTNNRLEEQDKPVVPVVTAAVDVSEIDDRSIIDDSFTNFKFDQEYEVGNAQPSKELTLAKRTLFEAGEIAKEAEEARQAAYSLPTADQRNEAFERANALTAASELKQLEAAEYFAEFNKKEFIINQRRLDNANDFEDEFESGNLDLANLLAEEAVVYYNNAAEIRSSIIPTDRLSRKEVDLQKAYDYEMLSLKKQRQALTKLSLADDEILNEVAVNSGTEEPFVQVITDPEVLAVKDPEVAKAKAESLQEEIKVLTLEAETQRNSAETIEVGAERDSLLAIYESSKVEIDEKQALAAIYIERESQLRSGNGNVQAIDEKQITANLISPKRPAKDAMVIDLDTVQIEDARKSLILESNAFVEYAKNEKSRDQLVSDAQVAYDQAVFLSKEKQRLIKQAVIEKNKAKIATDEAERQRLIKSANVIDQRLASTTKSIDSINNVIKVKNFLISSSQQKMNNAVANLSDIERAEFMKLSSEYEGEPLAADALAINNTNDLNNGNQELISEETSENISNLDPLKADQSSLNSVGVDSETDPTNNESSLAVNNSTSNTELEETDSKLDEPKVVENISKPSSTNNIDSRVSSNSNSSAIASETTVKKAAKNEKSSSQTEAITPIKTIPAKSKTNANQNTAKVSEPSSTSARNVDIDVIPRTIKQAIFVTLNKNVSNYSEEKPIPVNPEMPEGIVYKVQIGAFRNPISPEVFKGFAPLMAEKTQSGITRYTAGFFVTERTAIGARNEIRQVGYPDAFVVAFKNGKRISVSAARIENGEPASAENDLVTSSSNAINNQFKPDGQTGELSERFNQAEIAKVVDVKTIEGVYFTVQIGVFSAPVKKGTFNYPDLNVVELSNGLIRYNAGIYRNAIEAADAKITINTDIADAFLTSYYNGKRISINEATKLRNK